MSDFSTPSALVTPLHISTLSIYGCGYECRNMNGSTSIAAQTWVSGLAVYMPISLPWPYPVYRVWWQNGSTVTTTNVDFGIYNDDGIALYTTGSTTMVGASGIQYVTVGTPFLLGPGMYYLAWTCDNTTARGAATNGTAAGSRLAGLLQESSAFPLPATMTPVAFANAWGTNLCGITRTSTGF